MARLRLTEQNNMLRYTRELIALRGGIQSDRQQLLLAWWPDASADPPGMGCN
jgi:hypothetical protein